MPVLFHDSNCCGRLASLGRMGNKHLTKHPKTQSGVRLLWVLSPLRTPRTDPLYPSVEDRGG
jgi:hypothetical protein